MAMDEPSRLERLLSKSPAVLKGFNAFRGSLALVDLSPQSRARIALLVAEAYGCEHMLSKAVQDARELGLRDDEIAHARRGFSEQHTDRATLRYAEAILYGQGQVSDAEREELLAVGYTPDTAIEIVAHVALGTTACLFAKSASLLPEDEWVVPFYDEQ